MARVAGITATVLAASALLAAPAATASQQPAAKATIYNNIPSPTPGNVPSVAFEATGTSEFGGEVSFGGANRQKPQVTVLMSSWACQHGYWSTGNCGTVKKATFNQSVRISVYSVGDDGAVGSPLGSVTHTFGMPYRPSANYGKCQGVDAGKWYDKGTGSCYNGMAFTIKFKLGSLSLPDDAIISVSYNTSHYGYNPVGEAACYTADAGCAYDALNVGTSGDTPSAGTQPRADDAYLYATGGYCDPEGPTQVFRLDAGCWTGYQPAFKVIAS
jgi:hypothetical protein